MSDDETNDDASDDEANDDASDDQEADAADEEASEQENGDEESATDQGDATAEDEDAEAIDEGEEAAPEAPAKASAGSPDPDSPTVSARRARAGAWLALVGTLVLPALLVFAWSRELPVGPREMPALTLAPSEVAAQLAEDAADAADAPDGELALERARLYGESNIAEHRAADYPGRAELRRRGLAAAMDALREAEGPEVVKRLRAEDLERLEPALHETIPEAERVETLGGFVHMMRRYGMLDGDRQVAPRFVVRTIFKARWNAMHGLELTDGFSPVEQRAYFGWLALHADGAPVQQRLDAVESYAAAGGPRATEARAVLLFDDGRFEEAAEAFTEAYEESPSFRLRNHARAAALE